MSNEDGDIGRPRKSFLLSFVGLIPYRQLSDKGHEMLVSAIEVGIVVDIRHIENTELFRIQLSPRYAFAAGEEWISPSAFEEVWPTLLHYKLGGMQP